KNKFKNNQPVLIYIGRIQRSKKLDLLVNVLAELNNEEYPCNLTIIGSDVESNNILALISNLTLEDKVWMVGACYDEKRIGEFLYNADVCVSPGPIGLTALHALSYGCPVITNNEFNTQMPEFEAITPNVSGDFFEFGNKNSLKEVIKNWINLDVTL